MWDLPLRLAPWPGPWVMQVSPMGPQAEPELDPTGSVFVWILFAVEIALFNFVLFSKVGLRL